MFTHTGIAMGRHARPHLDALLGSALLGLCLVLVAAFLADVWRAPASPGGAEAAAAAAESSAACATHS